MQLEKSYIFRKKCKFFPQNVKKSSDELKNRILGSDFHAVSEEDSGRRCPNNVASPAASGHVCPCDNGS